MGWKKGMTLDQIANSQTFVTSIIISKGILHRNELQGFCHLSVYERRRLAFAFYGLFAINIVAVAALATLCFLFLPARYGSHNEVHFTCLSTTIVRKLLDIFLTVISTNYFRHTLLRFEQTRFFGFTRNWTITSRLHLYQAVRTDMDNADQLQVHLIDVDALDLLVNELQGLRESLEETPYLVPQEKPLSRWPNIRVQYEL